jgi:hypothetical protein
MPRQRHCGDREDPRRRDTSIVRSTPGRKANHRTEATSRDDRPEDERWKHNPDPCMGDHPLADAGFLTKADVGSVVAVGFLPSPRRRC